MRDITAEVIDSSRFANAHRRRRALMVYRLPTAGWR